MSPLVRRLSRREIDDDKWNRAVAGDAAPLPYGLSWWLDIVTRGRWDGLVLDDYRAVLPLTYRFKVGTLGVIAPPPFCQQQGPFGQYAEEELPELLSAVSRSLFSPTLHLRLPPGSGTRINQELSLGRAYERTFARYSRSLRKRLRWAKPAALSDCPPELVIRLYREQLGEKTGLTTRHYEVMEALMAACAERNLGGCYRLDDADGLLAAGFFPTFAGRTINLFAAPTRHGRTEMGMARLLDSIIERDTGPGRIFDFEGSNVAGVHAFFASFGAEDVGYEKVRF